MKTTVDAFGTEVIVGDTVVFFSSSLCNEDKNLLKGRVIKCTSHGATVLFGTDEINVRSGRIYKVPITNMSDEDVQRMVKDTLDKAWGNNQ